MATIWSATRVAADAAEHMQVDAGLLCSNYDITNPVAPADSDIITATTGDISINCTAQTQDFLEDVNNAPNNTKEGKRITGWECTFGMTALEFTNAVLKLAAGAADINANGGISPRRQIQLTDFETLYFLGDMVDEDKLFVVKMDNALSTGGIAITTAKNGKGKNNITLTAHTSLADIEKIPMEFYILEKVDGQTAYTFTAVSPVGTENPSEEGWYVLMGDSYVSTSDTEVDANKTYYERTAAV